MAQWRFANKLWTPFRSLSSVSGPSASAGEHAGGVKVWKLMSFVVALPGVAICWINAMLKEKEEAEHMKHHRPEFVAYDHLRLRTKKFPWGDGNHSMFHNKHLNALPGGYEE